MVFTNVDLFINNKIKITPNPDINKYYAEVIRIITKLEVIKINITIYLGLVTALTEIGKDK